MQEIPQKSFKFYVFVFVCFFVLFLFFNLFLLPTRVSYKCNSALNTPALFDGQSDLEFTVSSAILSIPERAQYHYKLSENQVQTYVSVYKITKIVRAFWLLKTHSLLCRLTLSNFIKAIDHAFDGFTGVISHLGCWENTKKACKSLAFGSCFTSFSRVLPTSRVVYHACKPIESVVYCLNISNLCMFEKAK